MAMWSILTIATHHVRLGHEKSKYTGISSGAVPSSVRRLEMHGERNFPMHADILLMHSPPKGNLDRESKDCEGRFGGEAGG